MDSNFISLVGCMLFRVTVWMLGGLYSNCEFCVTLQVEYKPRLCFRVLCLEVSKFHILDIWLYACVRGFGRVYLHTC